MKVIDPVSRLRGLPFVKPTTLGHVKPSALCAVQRLDRLRAADNQ